MDRSIADLSAASPPRRSAESGPWRHLHGAIGQEMFGRSAGPWGALFARVPVAGLGLTVMLAVVPQGLLPAWLAQRLAEAAWLLVAPFLLATVAQAIARHISERVWKGTQGGTHRDWSPRAWHYRLAAALAALPLVALQVSPALLDAWLTIAMKLQGAAHVGYTPSSLNVLVLLVLVPVFRQVRRLLDAVPPGRLLGMQRELARLRGAVAWEPEAWAALVEDTFDRWMSDLSPATSSASPSGEYQRQRRLRWGAFRKEAVASFASTPPDLARANRALLLYRQGK